MLRAMKTPTKGPKDRSLVRLPIDPGHHPLRLELQQLGLRPYEARVLLTLLQVESANSSDLAELSGVPRTSTYQVVAALNKLGLTETVPSYGTMIWRSVGWPAVFDALDAAEEKRVAQHHQRTRNLRRGLKRMLPSSSSAETVR